MTIDKAIEILKDIVNTAHYSDYPDDHGAIKLGIEALKRVRNDRGTSYQPVWYPLPGETKSLITLPPTLITERR